MAGKKISAPGREKGNGEKAMLFKIAMEDGEPVRKLKVPGKACFWPVYIKMTFVQCP